MIDTKRPFCFACGRQLAYNNAGVLVYATRDYHGSPIKMHKDCAKRWDEDKPLTARPTSEEPRHD